MNSAQNSNPNPWTVAREFIDTTSGVAVVVKRSTLPKRFAHELPRSIYSYEICRVNEQGKIGRYFSALVETVQGKVSYRKVLDMNVLTRLVHEAENWILDECQRHADEVITAKVEREQGQLNRDRPQQRPGLKALAKRDKAAREAAKP